MKFDTVFRVQIHLRKRVALKAALALYSQGKLGFRGIFTYTGPDFHSTTATHPRDDSDTGLEVACGHTTVNVVVDGEVEYIYPLSTVGRVKIEA